MSYSVKHIGIMRDVDGFILAVVDEDGVKHAYPLTKEMYFSMVADGFPLLPVSIQAFPLDHPFNNGHPFDAEGFISLGGKVNLN